MISKPKLFIGSSVEGLDVAYAVQENLKRNAEVTVWSQDSFELSKTTIESLMSILDASDFGIFVFSPDDVLKLKGKRYSAVRDNVIFELGLFIGKLGRERTFIVVPDNALSQKSNALHIPTDLLGITLGTFENSREDKKLVPATASFCTQVRAAVNLLGSIKKDADENPSDIKDKPKASDLSPSNIDPNIDWDKIVKEKKYDEAISILESLIAKSEKHEERIELSVSLMRYRLLKQGEDDLTELEEYIAKHNTDSLVYKHVILAIASEGHYLRAQQILEEAKTIFPNNSDILFAQVEILYRTGKKVEAIELFRKHDSHNADLSLRICNFLQEDEEHAQALEIAHNAYLKSPNNQLIIHRLGSIALDADRNELALYLYQRLLFDYPDSSVYKGYLGNACFNLELHDFALEQYLQAIELTEGKEGWILGNVGSLYRSQGFYTQAKNYFKRSIEIDKESAFNHTKLADTIRLQVQDNKRYEALVKKGRLEAFTAPTPNKTQSSDNDLPA